MARFSLRLGLVGVLLAGATLAPMPVRAGEGAVPTDRTSLIDRFLHAPVGTIPVEQFTGRVREFTLEVHRVQAEIAPGVKVEQWAFGFPGQTPTVPGPELRVQQGDLVRLTFRNTFDQPHSIHLHGIVSLAERMDGLKEVLPGESFTYEFVATDAGTFAYHCHVQTNLHLDMGMYGALVVEPRVDAPKVWNSEHTLILDEWDSRQDPNALVHHATPNYFLVNGRASPLIPDLAVAPGETSLLRMINLGSQVHSMHLHGVTFLVIAKDGHDLPAPYEADTLLIAPGERYDLLVRGRDGTFVFHDHIGEHATNDGVYPGGIHFMVRGGAALDEHGRLDLQQGAPAHGHDMGAAASAQSAATLLTNADAPSVKASGFRFAPSDVRVRAGTTVTWSNADLVAHAVVVRAPDGTETTRPLARGGRVSFTFDRPGTYTFHCLPHPFMTGKVVVE
ncbi:multicopper oxidase family protein [Deinococcus yavapaiensis]|uniref:FtsP/CotA-like multicopper oxidase with cupredoxin domain n=1 Tax=Deinococcus yavapaiensis KR-236 TaxID=694435 RepID=A0A318SE22_9DEIO|nr:multicopper oxidase domain-containing protein [Deinococcus yavapaiensis]PYE55311.1 FtsP/CotA-like multicopper oxidase with cupredoxin domain [Deinococcus yavapaiensis KR-236]